MTISLLTYCALPSRLRHLTQQTYDFVIAKGHAPLHPFITFPEKDFADKSTFGREQSLRFALQLVGASSQLYIFGISEGTIIEANRAYAQSKPIDIFVNEFDSDWKKYYPEMRKRFGDFLDQIFQRKKLL